MRHLRVRVKSSEISSWQSAAQRETAVARTFLAAGFLGGIASSRPLLLVKSPRMQTITRQTLEPPRLFPTPVFFRPTQTAPHMQ